MTVGHNVTHQQAEIFLPVNIYELFMLQVNAIMK